MTTALQLCCGDSLEPSQAPTSPMDCGGQDSQRPCPKRTRSSPCQPPWGCLHPHGSRAGSTPTAGQEQHSTAGGSGCCHPRPLAQSRARQGHGVTQGQPRPSPGHLLGPTGLSGPTVCVPSASAHGFQAGSFPLLQQQDTAPTLAAVWDPPKPSTLCKRPIIPQNWPQAFPSAFIHPGLLHTHVQPKGNLCLVS